MAHRVWTIDIAERAPLPLSRGRLRSRGADEAADAVLASALSLSLSLYPGHCIASSLCSNTIRHKVVTYTHTQPQTAAFVVVVADCGVGIHSSPQKEEEEEEGDSVRSIASVRERG